VYNIVSYTKTPIVAGSPHVIINNVGGPVELYTIFAPGANVPFDFDTGDRILAELICETTSGSPDLFIDYEYLTAGNGYSFIQTTLIPRGETGAQGAQGFQGTTGAQGFQGFQGVTGVTGAKGETGAQGFQGVTGAKGETGAQGLNGVTGAQGTTGPAQPNFYTNYTITQITGPTGFNIPALTSSPDYYNVYQVDTTSGPITINLPLISSLDNSQKRIHYIVDSAGQLSNNNLIITPTPSNTIGGESSATIVVDYSSVQIMSNTTDKWLII
jgi:hypothetical protein